jgi:hypothetical protein
MSLPTNHPDEWWLIKDDPKVIVEEIRDATTGAVTGYQKRNIFTVIIKRFLFKVTTLQTAIDTTRSSFDVRTSDGTRIAVAYTGKKFLCVESPRELVDPLTGKYEETQVWVHKSESKPVASGTFG